MATVVAVELSCRFAGQTVDDLAGSVVGKLRPKLRRVGHRNVLSALFLMILEVEDTESRSLRASFLLVISARETKTELHMR